MVPTNRRTFLHRGGIAALGAGAAALIGCSSSNSNSNSTAATSTKTTVPSSGAALTSTPGSAGAKAPANLATSQVLRVRFFFELLPLDPATIFGIEQENTAIAVYNGLTMYNGKT